MATLAAVWDALSGPRVEDFWVEVLDVDETPGPPVNLVSGDTADFEGGTVGSWVPGGADPKPTLTNSTARANNGGRSMLIAWQTGGSFPQAAMTLPTVPGHTYTVRMYAWVPTGSPAVLVIASGSGGSVGSNTGSLKDGWALISTTWTATLTSYSIQIWPDSTAETGDQAWVDEVFIYDHDADTGSTFAESPRGALDGVTSCRVEHNVNATIRGGCSLSLRDTGQALDWASVRFRPWVRVNDKTWPLGVFLPASPSLSMDEHGASWEVPCLDKTSILDQDHVIAAYSVPAGTVVTEAVALLIESTGESSGSITPSTLTTRSPMTWEAGTTKLRIINDLLDSINYFAVWADRHGQFRAEPYRRPQDRTLAATFASGESSILSPRWSREQDIAGVPNRTVLIVEGDDEEPGLTATATNTDPASPYSTVSRGRVVSRVYDNVEAADQATLDDLAARYLAEASTPSATLSVAHASVPLDGNAVVRFADGDVDTLAVVEGWQLDLAPSALMSGTWREIVS